MPTQPDVVCNRYRFAVAAFLVLSLLFSCTDAPSGDENADDSSAVADTSTAGGADDVAGVADTAGATDTAKAEADVGVATDTSGPPDAGAIADATTDSGTAADTGATAISDTGAQDTTIATDSAPDDVTTNAANDAGDTDSNDADPNDADSNDAGETSEPIDTYVPPQKICVPGAKKCADASVLLVCDVTGMKWMQASKCAAQKATCLAGACVKWKCTPKATDCSKDGKSLAVCDATGQLTVEFPCPAAHLCVDKACKKQVCKPLAAVCKGNVVFTCGASGMKEEKSKDCGKDVCVAGACKKKTCAKGSATCSDAKSRKVCNATETGFDVVPCGAQQACDKGVCAAKVCTAKATKCVGSAVWTCNAVGTNWAKTKTCGAKQACAKGACVDLKCTPGEAKCDGLTLRTCAQDGLSWRAKACADGNACTADACDAQKGGCSFGPPKACKSSTVCAVGACDAKTGFCQFVPKAGACDDGNKCTVKDVCAAGKCAPGTVMACNDGNACTADTCAKSTGKCSYKPMSEGAKCADGSICTVGVCKKRICKPAGLRCAGDEVQVCDASGTTWKGQTNCATAKQACAAGKCVAATCTVGARLCHKGQLATCNADGKSYTTKSCDDNNACTTDVCAGQPLDCAHPATKTCDDGFGCTDDICDTITGVCTNPTKKGACDDGKDCTVDWCSTKTGKCAHKTAAVTAACNDNNVCTTDDKCAVGGCAGTPRTCSDGDPCTTDTCLATGKCGHQAAQDGASCADNHPCVGKGTCKNGTCSAKSTCTWSVVHSDTIDCGDKGWTLKSAVGSTAAGWAIDATSNAVAFHSKWCSLNFNNGTSYATGGRVGGTATSAPIKLPAGSYLRLQLWDYNGVENTALRDHRIIELSDDGFAKRVTTYRLANHVDRGKWAQRTVGIDPMFAGKSVQVRLRFDTMDGKDNQGPGWYVDDLTVAAAKMAAKTCKTAKDCDDGDPCSIDTCASGSCAYDRDKAHAACNDGDPCSWDTCKAQVGCAHGPTYATCDDNSACTSNDNCLTGTCTGIQKDCNDANSCTADSCQPKTGSCAHKPQKNGSKCEDHSKCTVGDICKNGACGGPAKVCKDGVGCTLDSCDPASGACVFPTDPAVCSDGKVCTEDVCNPKTGKCSSALRPNCCTLDAQCKDGVSCTNDSCDKTSNECLFVASSSACNDNNACTTDACSLAAKKCTNIAIKGCCTSVKQCNDNNPCTVDSCSQSKCKHTNTGCDNSCFGRCGKYDSKKKCQCDTSCTKYGDCCADKKQLCG